MIFKNSFLIPQYSSGVPGIKEHLKKRKAAELGEKIAECFGYKEKPASDPGYIYDLEIFACPIVSFYALMKKIRNELPEEYSKQVEQWVNDLEKPDVP